LWWMQEEPSQENTMAEFHAERVGWAGFKAAAAMFLLAAAQMATEVARAAPIDFENLPDSQLVQDFYQARGLIFENAISLTAGFSLNEIDFPPHSGSIAIGDNAAPLALNFQQPTS